MTDVIVIGGGPAGMMAAATAALYGKRSFCLRKTAGAAENLPLREKAAAM